jgi:hypothetical protein
MVINAEHGDFAGDRPDHQHPFCHTALHKIIVSLLLQGGFGDDLAIQFHNVIIVFPVNMGKPGNAPAVS